MVYFSRITGLHLDKPHYRGHGPVWRVAAALSVSPALAQELF